MVDKALFSSARHDWNTPGDLLIRLREFSPIGLDPCSNERSAVAADLEWFESDDGLTKEWAGRGLVFVNPPYGRGHIGKWAEKCAAEAKKGAEVIALLPVRTDAKWFQDNIFSADRILYIAGRLKFKIDGPSSSATFPSCLAYWGPQAPRFSMVLGSLGVVCCAWPKLKKEF